MLDELKQFLLSRHYPEKSIDSTIARMLLISKEEALKRSRKKIHKSEKQKGRRKWHIKVPQTPMFDLSFYHYSTYIYSHLAISASQQTNQLHVIPVMLFIVSPVLNLAVSTSNILVKQAGG